MSVRSFSTEGVISGGLGIMRAGLEGGGGVVKAYGKPALEKSASLTAQAASWGAENPTLTTCAVVGLAGVALLAAPGCATAPALSAIGFTAEGIQAGSSAAAFHSSIGNIVSGSAIAVAQSAGAGGSGLAVVNGVTQLGGAAMTAGSAGIAWVKAKL
ncbi:uncharacterized protein KD926_003479 [Aspergillus affinis]|uniref:uncharacterized protein n=1 Tax=Aspergillus affinis TaxID=1070780 RepID=UPI0022FE9FC6|nr:uncharacterized protein KD926_003479 [Aspergillus affinis]KAI9035453.1 hypothetical protein KD926_003479 [Aspergillus affinis]